MDDSSTIATTRRLLAVIERDPPPSDQELAQALDALAMAYHDAPEGEPADDGAEPPKREHADYMKRYRALGASFPDHGYYAVADPTETIPSQSLLGDAIDDLADIALDLDQVICRFENIGADDAHWHFKFNYRAHWGMHLRELSHYLHAKIWITDCD